MLQFLLPLLGLLGRGASALGQGRQQERTAQNQYGQNNNALLASLYGTQQNAQNSQYGTQQNAALQALLGQSAEGQSNVRNDLSRREFALNAPSTRAGQAVRGSLLQTLQPATMSGGSARLRAATPTISGGVSAANLNPGAREAGRLLEEGAVNGLRTGEQFDPLPPTDFQSGRLPAPTPIPSPNLAAYQQPGKVESILGLLGLIAPDLLGAFRNRASGDTGNLPTGSNGGY